MNEFDQAARYTAKIDPPSFFRWLIPGLDPALVFQGWADTRTLPFPGEPDRTCDTVAVFVDPSRLEDPWGIVVEFQSEPETDMLLRLLEYLTRIRRELRPADQPEVRYRVAGALVNLTGRARPRELEMRLPGRTDVGVWVGVALKTVQEEDASATLDEIAAGRTARCILPWIPLMHGAAEADIMAQWKEIAATEPSSQLRTSYAGLALVFADLAGCREQWTVALEDWNVRKSVVVEEWREEARVETKREDVLRVLQLRFPGQLPADLVAAIEGMTDKEELSRWFDTAVTAPSLAAFRSSVQQEAVRP